MFSKGRKEIRKNMFACLFIVHNTISLSRHEQVCLMRLLVHDKKRNARKTSLSTTQSSLDSFPNEVAELFERSRWRT